MGFDARNDKIKTPFGSMFINPGSGPVADTTLENAEANIKAFIQDLLAIGEHAGQLEDKLIYHYTQLEKRGRYTFLVYYRGEKMIEVEMPGLPLEQVRYLGEPGQDIWDFPRLYVDGSSWIWKYAIDITQYTLLNDEEEGVD